MTTLDDLRNRAIQTACRSLKDPGPPLNPIVFTEKGSALLDGEKAMKDAGNAALSFLKEIDSTIRPNLYCILMNHIVEVPGKDPRPMKNDWLFLKPRIPKGSENVAFTGSD